MSRRQGYGRVTHRKPSWEPLSTRSKSRWQAGNEDTGYVVSAAGCELDPPGLTLGASRPETYKEASSKTVSPPLHKVSQWCKTEQLQQRTIEKFNFLKAQFRVVIGTFPQIPQCY